MPAIRMIPATIMPALLEQTNNAKMTMKTKNKNRNSNAFGGATSCSSSSSPSEMMTIDEDRSSSSSSSSSSSIIPEETSVALSSSSVSSSSLSSLLSLSMHNNNNGGGTDNLTVTVSSVDQRQDISFLHQHRGGSRGRKSCMKKVVALRDDAISDDEDDLDDVLDPYNSTNNSNKNSISKKKKKVRFAHPSQHNYVEAVDWSQVSPPITSDELFYTSSNYEKMRGECSWTIRCHQMMMASSSSSTSSPSSSDINHHHNHRGRDGDDGDNDSCKNGWVESYEDDDEFFRHEFEESNLCLRGLEGQTEEATRKRLMRHAKQTRALMIEQDRQKQQQSRRSAKPYQRSRMNNIHRMNMLTQNNHQRAHHLPLLFRLHHIGSRSISSNNNTIDNDDVRCEDYEERLADACRGQSAIDVSEAYRVGLEDAKAAQEVYYESIHNHQTHDNDDDSNDPLQEWWCSFHEDDDIIERLTRSSVFVGIRPKKKMKKKVDDDDDANGHSDVTTSMIVTNQPTTVTQLAPVATMDECYSDDRNDTITARLTVLDTLPWPLKILHNIMRPKSCWE